MEKNDTTITLAKRIEAGWLSVMCPSCKAQPGERCRTPKGKEKADCHGPRFEFASACNRIPIV